MSISTKYTQDKFTIMLPDFSDTPIYFGISRAAIQKSTYTLIL